MTRTKKRNFILALAAILFAALAALLIISPKTVVKADETETLDYSKFSVVEPLTPETSAAGISLNRKILVWGSSHSGQITYTEPSGDIVLDGSGTLEFLGSGYSYTINGNTDSEIIAILSETSGRSDISYFFYISDEIDLSTLTLDTRNMTIASIMGAGGVSDYGCLLSMAEEEPNNEPENEHKPFDLGEWLHTAGDNVSAWLGENVGISVTGGTVLIVGAVIIIVLFRRRRR